MDKMDSGHSQKYARFGWQLYTYVRKSTVAVRSEGWSGAVVPYI
jgi:hypothetical protein